MKEISEIILPDDDRSAKFASVKGWVSRNNLFFGDNEELARIEGCTHRPCMYCNVPLNKNRYLACESCRSKKEDEKYFKREVCSSYEGMIYDLASDEYFHEVEDAIENAESEDIPVSELRLCPCDPVTLRELDTDRFMDDLSEDDDIPSFLQEAIDEFNDKIRGKVVSWYPSSKYRIEL